ncbi:hypothetical protein [Parapedobacter lycopersici]|uniref:hypothetical protein n=1 Tax=Parapedobacter lycopersici TaxID=1864939 RepID=UPI00214D20E8|nr:hypothetical protein [Parapedobacter lycopersici]
MKTLLKRFLSETPKFWKKAAWFGGALTAISVGLLSAPETIAIPAWMNTVAGYLATAGFVMTLLAKATTTDHDLSEK